MDEGLRALTVAMKGYRSPPRQVQSVMAEEFYGISEATLDALVQAGLLEKKRIRFSGETVYDAYSITPRGVAAYGENNEDDDEFDDLDMFDE